MKILPPEFSSGGGIMGEMIRNYDWSNTEVGFPENWPTSLLNLTSVLLSSKYFIIVIKYYIFHLIFIFCLFNLNIQFRDIIHTLVFMLIIYPGFP